MAGPGAQRRRSSGPSEPRLVPGAGCRVPAVRVRSTWNAHQPKSLDPSSRKIDTRAFTPAGSTAPEARASWHRAAALAIADAADFGTKAWRTWSAYAAPSRPINQPASRCDPAFFEASRSHRNRARDRTSAGPFRARLPVAHQIARMARTWHVHTRQANAGSTRDEPKPRGPSKVAGGTLPPLACAGWRTAGARRPSSQETAPALCGPRPFPARVAHVHVRETRLGTRKKHLFNQPVGVSRTGSPCVSERSHKDVRG
jgi:hypothetical protein